MTYYQNIKYLPFAVIVLLGLALIFEGFGTVPAGYRGVQLRFGAVSDVILEEGLYFKIPFIDEVKKVSCMPDGWPDKMQAVGD